jgi:hypothetical protein
VLFYYSGHAKATALDLGKDQLPLPELRQKLFDLPSKLTVVVLDACQSGAFSRVKGAAPTADFSFNSRQQLDATGVAVLASSSGSELSQESEQLKSSYFTHHLLVGLRGAGDSNSDGQVTVDEAYRYAYHQTLLATAETAVGGQHVSLEVDLKGHGEVPLSFPRAATAHIELPAKLEGKTLIEDKRAKTVVAETYKAKGTAVRVAVAPGDYRVIVRHGSTISRCDVDASGNLARCKDEAIVSSTTKGGGWARPYRIELMGQLGGERHDAYTDTLENFGYKEQMLAISAGLTLSGLTRVHEYLWVGGIAASEGMPEWKRDTDGLYPQTFKASMFTLAPSARVEVPITQEHFFGRHSLYAQLGLGLGIGQTKHYDQNDKLTSDTYVGPAMSFSTGMRMGGDRFGLAMGYGFSYAHVIDNLIGDTHGSGGHRLTISLGYGF